MFPIPSITEIAAKLGGVAQANEVLCPGPGHSPQDRSLSVKLDDKAPDGFLVHSFAGDDALACKDYVRSKLGLRPFQTHSQTSGNGSAKPWTLLSEHVYQDELGQPYLRVCKCRDGNDRKQYPQAHWDGKAWIKGKPSGPKIPYRLPELLAASLETNVYIVEGEACADAVARLGFVCTTSSEGADTGNGKKWAPELNKWFKNRNVVIVGDNDDPGRRHVQHVAQNLFDVAATVRVLDLAKHWPGEAMPAGFDVVEWIEQHDHDGSRLVQLAKESPLWDANTDGPAAALECAGAEPDDEFDEDDDRKPKQADLLIALAQRAALFHDDEGNGYADLDINGHRETWRVRSPGLKRWLLWSYFKQYKSAPNAEAMTAALGVIEAQAIFEGPEQRVAVRVGHYDEKLYLDLCDETWRAIEIDVTGWRIIDCPPIRFIRSGGMLPLPTPQQGGAIEALRPLINVKSDQDFTLVVAWLLAALRDQGPFPVLVVTGQHGSAKSTLLEILRRLIDPNVANLRSPPKDPDDLYITATLSHIIPYDNLSHIPEWMSDALARIATGTAYAKRKLYTDSDEVLLCAEKPIALNGITEIVGAADLGDRSVFIVAQPIDPKERKTKAEIWAGFDRRHPAILGALLDALVHGLRTLPTVTDTSWPRMADFAMWATACEGAYAQPGTFKAAYADNRADAIGAMIEGDAVASAVLRLALPWSGQLAKLLDTLIAIVGDGQARGRTWPKSPRALGDALRRAAPLLTEHNLAVTPPPKKDKTRTWEINRRSELAERGRDEQPKQPKQPSQIDYPNKPGDLGLADGSGGREAEDLQRPEQPDRQPATNALQIISSGDLGGLGCSHNCSETGVAAIINALEERVCVQCRGAMDGKERLCSVAGEDVWLHPECKRFYGSQV